MTTSTSAINITYKPFFNKEETSGRFFGEVKKLDFQARVKNNRKRGLKISKGKLEAKRYIRDIEKYWFATNDLSLETEIELSKLRRSLNECCNHTLLREHKDGSKEFIGAHTCKHKICPVCNAKRCRDIRKRYISLFKKDPTLLTNYDFFHLTLTVPHNEQGYRGKNFYADELIKDFNQMRRLKFWKKMVYAGEFGVEVTRNENGLHIHIHALLLVYKSRQNRNELHKKVLIAWNKQTSGTGNRDFLSEEQVAAICKSNNGITSLTARSLRPDGATMIGLESLYTSSKEPKPGYIYCARTGQYKRYIKPSHGLDSMMFGILECIKYHFEPMSLKKDGNLDVELLCEILPNIKNKKMYQRFGAFYGGCKNAHPDCKLLNLSSSPTEALDTVENDLKGVEFNEVVHPETGEKISPDDYQYLIVKMTDIYIDEENENRIKLKPRAKKSYLPEGITLEAALLEMELRSVDVSMASSQGPRINRLKRKYAAA